MPFLDYTDTEWDAIENRVLANIPIASVKNQEEFKQQLLNKFFNGRDETELTRKQILFGEQLWNDLADKYEEGYGKRHPMININIKEYPTEAKRFFRAMKIYNKILKIFNKGYHRKDVVKYYAHETGRRPTTIQRDISAIVKVGALSKRYKKRGYYEAKSSVYV